MGKASRTKQRLTPREKVAIQQAAERRRQVRNRTWLALGCVGLVVVIVIAFVVIKASSHSKNSNSQLSAAQLATVVSDVTNVPVSTLAAVGGGPTSGTERISPPQPLSGQPPLTQNGKPQIVYVGAEYCPFCAAERWAIVVALSRFGTFTNLGTTQSDANDVFPKTNTLTFHKSSYSSPYLVFSPVEETDSNKNPLETPSPLQQQLIAKYDAPPFVASANRGAIPFIDLGNKFFVSGASYSPQVLQGKSWTAIAAALKNPSSPIAQVVNGAANVLTADICKLTGNKPANVCGAAPITSLNQ